MSLGKGRQEATRADEAAGATGGDGAALDPLSAPAAPFVEAPLGPVEGAGGTTAGEESVTAPRKPRAASPAASTFPTSDAFLARTIVYDDPRTSSTVQTLVSLYSNGEVEVAQRPTPGASWGPPWTLREDEGW